MSGNESQIDVSRETRAKLERYVSMLEVENGRQNLVSPATLPTVWDRHILDSLQLGNLIHSGESVVDIGSGGGLPGIPLACIGRRVTMVEPRRLRAEFLADVVANLGLENATVIQGRAETTKDMAFDVITARAVAPLTKLLAMTYHLAKKDTKWVFPKGEKAHSELEEARKSWHCAVREVASATNPGSRIFVLTDVGAKKGR